MSPPDWNTILTFLGGVLAAVLTTAAARPTRQAEAHQSRAQGEASLSEATMKWAHHIEETLNKRVESLNRRVSSLEVENEVYRRYNSMLIEQLTDAGITPLEPPPKRRGDSD